VSSIQLFVIVSKALEGIGLQPASPERPLTANWKIFRAAIVIGAWSVVAKFAATGKELAVAAWFARSDALDAFLIAMILPTTLVGFIAGSFSGALIPTYIHIRENRGQKAAEELFSNVQVLSLLLLVVATTVMGLGASYYLPLLGSGFGSAKLLLTRRLLYMLLPFLVLNGTLSVWSSILNASERFTLPALTPVVTPLVVILALLILGRVWGIFAIAVGTIAGGILEVTLLGWAIHAQGISLRPRWHGFSPELRLVVKQYGPMIASALLMGTSPIIDQSMAAMLKSGSVAALSYGNKIVTTIAYLCSAALSIAILPYLSQMVTKKDWSGCRRTLKVYSSLVLSATIPIAIGLIVCSRPLVRLLYQRGAFTTNDTEIVSVVQVFFAILIPFYTWAVLFVRLLSSLNRNDLLAYAAVMNVCLNVLFNFILMRRFGVAGIALSTSLVYLISCIFLGFWALKLLRKEESAGSLY
jgi:putative peptidoglycan lipid II flippase